MKARRFHIPRDDGRALCGRAWKQGDKSNPRGRCENIRVKNEEKEKRRNIREKAAKERAEKLEAGMLVELASGSFALRYSLGGKIVTESIGTADGRKAAILAPLCMKQIRRTGRPLNQAPKCKSDLL